MLRSPSQTLELVCTATGVEEQFHANRMYKERLRKFEPDGDGELSRLVSRRRLHQWPRFRQEQNWMVPSRCKTHCDTPTQQRNLASQN